MVTARPNADNDHPVSTEVIDPCRTTLAELGDQLRAAAVIADISLPEGGNAIRVELEHIKGPVLTVLLTYATKQFGRNIDYGQLSAAAAPDIEERCCRSRSHP